MRWTRRLRRRAATRGRRLTCIEIVELLTDYFDDALSPSRRAAVAAHLADCPDCARYLEQLTVTVAAVRGVDQPGLPDEAGAALVAAFRDFPRG